MGPIFDELGLMLHRCVCGNPDGSCKAVPALVWSQLVLELVLVIGKTEVVCDLCLFVPRFSDPCLMEFVDGLCGER